MEFSVEYSITKIFDRYSPSLHYHITLHYIRCTILRRCARYDASGIKMSYVFLHWHQTSSNASQISMNVFSHLTMICSNRLYFICACSKRRESSPTFTGSSSVGLTTGWSSPWRTSAGWRRRRSESWRRWEWHLCRIMVWSMNISSTAFVPTHPWQTLFPAVQIMKRCSFHCSLFLFFFFGSFMNGF